MWDWVKRNWKRCTEPAWLFARGNPFSLRSGYEKAGLVVWNEPIPWNADAVFVEIMVPASIASDCVTELLVRTTDNQIHGLSSIDRIEEEYYRLRFQVGVPNTCVGAAVYWRGCRLAQMALPHLSASDFFNNICLESPAIFARLGGQLVACEAFVEGQADGLVACATLRSPTSLLPLVDSQLAIEITEHRAPVTYAFPIRVVMSYLTGRHVPIPAYCPIDASRPGCWSVSWLAGGRCLGRCVIRTASPATFRQSLRLMSGVSAPEDSENFSRPCFRVLSLASGVAGVCSLELHATSTDIGIEHAGLVKDTILVTDGPSPPLRASVSTNELSGVTGIVFLGDGELLDCIRDAPKPPVRFTTEGGFRGSQEFAWTVFAEAELNARLGRLFTPSAT